MTTKKSPFVIVEGGLVTNEPCIPVYDLDFSDDPHEALEEMVTLLYDMTKDPNIKDLVGIITEVLSNAYTCLAQCIELTTSEAEKTQMLKYVLNVEKTIISAFEQAGVSYIPHPLYRYFQNKSKYDDLVAAKQVIKNEIENCRQQKQALHDEFADNVLFLSIVFSQL